MYLYSTQNIFVVYYMKVIKRICQFIFRRPLIWLLSKLHSAPKKDAVFSKLSKLYTALMKGEEDLGTTIDIDLSTDKYVVISDVHKGSGNAADDFQKAAANYEGSLYYYLKEGYTIIHLGDVEELWENSVSEVLVQNESNILVEKKFVEANRLHKVAGNHDLYWRTSPASAKGWLTKMYGKPIPVHEAILLKTMSDRGPLQILLTHGHQGDSTSDGNKFSKWFVANIWCKVQAFLEINPNAPSKDFLLRDKHNKLMYDWSTQQENTILITGHTHKPVFASANHIDELNRQIIEATQKNETKKIANLQIELNKRKEEYITYEPYTPKIPTYYNSGCCCFSDGDMTMLEIANNCISLVKWTVLHGELIKEPLRTITLANVMAGMQNPNTELYV
jgi:predicted phosphodiesterase